MTDAVNHPAHYTQGPIHSVCGKSIEWIDVTRGMSFPLGSVVKYLWRCDLKGQPVEDLRKARWYLDDEILRRERWFVEAPEWPGEVDPGEPPF